MVNQFFLYQFNCDITFLMLFYKLIIKIVKYVLFIMYLEFVDNSIANIGAIFLGKSVMENMECVQCKKGAEVRLWAAPLLEADGNL